MRIALFFLITVISEFGFMLWLWYQPQTERQVETWIFGL
jgi:hypothetical protein